MGRYHAAARAFKYQLMSNGEQQRQMRRFAGSSTATRTQGLGQGSGGCQSGPHGTWAEEVPANHTGTKLRCMSPNGD
jgi:hypothetical protein